MRKEIDFVGPCLYEQAKISSLGLLSVIVFCHAESYLQTLIYSFWGWFSAFSWVY